MSRLRKWSGFVLGAFCLAAPYVAFADVFQVDAAGYRAVTAGSAVRPAEAARRPAEVPAYTETVETAGPQEWQRFVGILAKKYDLSPALLEAVVWQESRWREAAVSSAGARGLAQLMPGTANQLGVDISDPAANLEGGARYLRTQLDTFGGDVERALAAYNAGPGRVNRTRGVPKIPETEAYVAAIMARLSDRVRR
jgi:soluble lytic murein transglycosylase-like protein